MMANAHLIGTLRRVLKLLHNKIRPIFVFDGGVPVLKKRISEARRQRVEHSATMYRRAAHKLLLNQLVQRRLQQSLPKPAGGNKVAPGFVLAPELAAVISRPTP